MIFADLELARRLERAEATAGARYVEARGRLFPNVGATWIDVAGTYAMFDGPTSPITQTFGLGLFSEDMAGDIDRVESFFRERGAPVCHEVSPLAGVAVADLLIRRGYRPIELTSVMYMPMPADWRSQTPAIPRLRARRMVPGEEEIWSSVSARGWAAEQPGLTDFLLDAGRLTAAVEGALPFFAHLDGNPVAAGVLRVDNRVALFAGACTIPEARNRGAQRALFEARMQEAAHQGCDLAMVCAAPGSSSQRNAERQGFRIAYTRTKWELRR